MSLIINPYAPRRSRRFALRPIRNMSGVLNPFALAPAAGGGAMPTWVGLGTSSAGSGNVTPGMPTGWAANDIHFLFCESSNEAVATPSNWGIVTNSPQGVGTAAGISSVRLSAFWRRAVGGDTAPTVTDPGNHCLAVICGVRGCPASGDPWHLTGGNVTTPANVTGTLTEITTTVVNCFVLLINACGFDLSDPCTCAVTNGTLTSKTDRFAENTSASNGGALAITTGERITAGGVGSTTFVWNGGGADQVSTHGMMSIALIGA